MTTPRRPRAETAAITRRQALSTLGAAALAAARPARASRSGRPPNLLFILADDLGYGDLGCFGQQVIQTPCLDRLATEGTRFTDVYAGSTVCAPSRCCLMTGLHTGHCRIRGNANVPLAHDDVTVAEVLKQAGYTTALIGKWGLGEPDSTGLPTSQGFDSFFGYLNQRHAHNYWPTYLWRGEERVPLDNVVPDEDRFGAGVATVRHQYSHDLFTEEALRFIDEHRAAPFFLYLAYTIPHANDEAKKEGMEVPDLGAYAKQAWPAPELGKAAMISRLDRDIGRLMDRLRRHDLDERTLVIFTSDNGPHKEGGADPEFFHSSGPLRGIKRDLYEGGIRVPTIARWPGRVPAGRVSTQPWAFWDVLPTAAELAGAATPTGLDGVSMLPTLLGRPQTEQSTFLYWEFHERGFQQAARMGNWKAVRKAVGAPLELYDLVADVGETTDLAAQQSAIVAGFEAKFATCRTDSPHWPIRERRGG